MDNFEKFQESLLNKNSFYNSLNKDKICDKKQDYLDLYSKHDFLLLPDVIV